MTYWKRNLFYILCIFMMGIPSALAGELLASNVFTLGEIVVSAERGSVSPATTVTEVSMEDISAKGASTVAEALEFIPGVSVQSAGKGEVHVSIRGFEQNQVKVLIDGVPARENYFGTVDLSMLPADAISKIVVTKGASSVLYGSSTMGGVINIITKKGGDRPETSLSASFGDYGTAHYFISHGGSRGNLNYWLSGGYQTSDGYRLSGDFDANDPVTGLGSSYNEDGGKRDLSYYTKKSINAKIGYDPGGDSSLYLSFDYVDNDRGMPTFFNRYWAYDHWRQWQTDLVGQHKFNDFLTVKARVFYVNHNDGITDVSWDAAHTTGGKKWFEKSFYDDYSIGGEFQTVLNFGPRNNLHFGINYMEDNHEEGNYFTDDCWNVMMGWNDTGWQPEQEYAARTYALAVEDRFKVSDRFTISAGLSFDTFEPTRTADQPAPGMMDTLNPQVGIVFDMTDAMQFHLSVGKKTRFPSLKELYSTFGGGNPDLDPEKAVAYEVGVSHFFSEAITGEAAFFYHDIDDLIDTVKIDGNNVYININEATIYGAEATLDMKPTDALGVNLNYTYLTTVDKSNDDRDLQGRPRHRVNLETSYSFPFGLRADMQASYTLRQYWQDNDYEWAKIPDYFLLNVKLTQKLKPAGGVESEIFFQGSNILDEDYYETSGPEPGFNFLAGITMRM